jgi:hypothetical protein
MADTQLSETPRRIAAAYAELSTPTPFRATTFLRDDARTRQEFLALTAGRKS